MKCWGSNRNGVLGIENNISKGSNVSDMGEALAPVIFGSNRVSIFSPGYRDSCILNTHNEVKCWGYWMALGSESPKSIGGASGEMGDALVTVNLGELPFRD
ncbi:MAG: hypothetical protein NTV34_02735 [Proteobacteria bacterium]|nr:hypothetical protein [Pseudomonadota bacterium]